MLWMAVGLVLLLILAAPATIRVRRRTVRLNGEGEAEERVESAWAEIRADLDIVEGSHGDAPVVDKAFAGADAVFWLTPPDPRAIR